MFTGDQVEIIASWSQVQGKQAKVKVVELDHGEVGEVVVEVEGMDPLFRFRFSIDEVTLHPD